MSSFLLFARWSRVPPVCLPVLHAAGRRADAGLHGAALDDPPLQAHPQDQHRVVEEHLRPHPHLGHGPHHTARVHVPQHGYNILFLSNNLTEQFLFLRGINSMCLNFVVAFLVHFGVVIVKLCNNFNLISTLKAVEAKKHTVYSYTVSVHAIHTYGNVFIFGNYFFIFC